MRTPWILAAVLCAAWQPAAAATFRIGPDAGPCLVVFESSAPLETFEGKTGTVAGTLELDPTVVPDSLGIEVQVDLRTLDTGIALRDRHMRENHLHTDEHPHATFTGARVLRGAGANLSDGRLHALVLEGTLSLHGVDRSMRIPVRMGLVPGKDGSRLRLTSEFQIALPDHEIPRPRFLVMKLDEVQSVRVDVWARPEAP